MYVDLLLNNFSGKSSELSMILQYMYHQQYYKSINKDLAADIDEILIDEIENMDMLGDLIKQLGGKPEYRMGMNADKYWAADILNYQTDFCAMLRSDMALKKASIDEYSANIDKIDDVSIKNTLKRMLRQEIMHYNIFEEYYEQFCDLYSEPVMLENESDNESACPFCNKSANTMIQPNANKEMLSDVEDYDVEDYDMTDDTMNEYNAYPNSANTAPFLPSDYTESNFCEHGVHMINEESECGYGCEFDCGCGCNCSDKFSDDVMSLHMEPMFEMNAPMRYKTSRPKYRMRKYI